MIICQGHYLVVSFSSDPFLIMMILSVLNTDAFSFDCRFLIVYSGPLTMILVAGSMQ